ncbi:MAG: DinB family protein [Kiloniellaceae bacterium]
MTNALIRNFRTLARYNRLANERLYAACARLSEAERKKVRPAFFKSIHGTLNHVMVGDRIWLTRFAGGQAPSTGLDAILYEDFDDLRTARAAEDARIEAFAAGLTAEFLRGTIPYVNNEGRLFEDPVDLLVAHLFNHQTHHRGQVHDMLCQTDVAPPVLDLHRVLKPEPDG